MNIPKQLIETALQFGPRMANPEILDGLTSEALGRRYAEYYDYKDSNHHDAFWVWELMNHIGREEPLLALNCIISALRQPLTVDQASCIAAAVLEEIIAFHGTVVIAEIESIALKSARFRYVLSGVWPLGEDEEGEIWQRVQRAVDPGPYMDQGSPVSPVDL